MAYNERNQPVRMRLGTNQSGVLGCGTVGDDWCIELGYGAVGTENNGNIWEQRIWARKADNGYLNLRQTYDFDGLNRLTLMGESVLGGGSGGGSWTETNMYDRRGKRWAVNSGSQSFLTPAESGWIESSTNRVTVARVTPTALGTVSYYAGGQLKSHPSVGALLKWDVESQLRSVDGAQYFYDGEGQRVRKEVVGVTTYYALDGMGKLGAEYGGTPGSGGVRYLTVDHLGSTRVVTDGFGVVRARCDYSAFGEVLMGTAGVGNRNAIGEYACGDGGVSQKFTGKERDAESGLDYFGARYLSGGMGRFVSADPKMFPDAVYDPQSWNKYGYVRNNPLRLIDPDGEDWKDVLAGTFNSVRTNATLGIGRTTGGNTDYRLGQKIGDGISMAGGAIEMVWGASTTASGAAACGSGVGCLVGAPAIVAGIATAAHGSAMTGTALVNFMEASDGAPTSSGNDAPFEGTPQNQDRMSQGKAPVGKDGKPVELHHEGQANNGPLKEMTRTDHRVGDNFKKNHPNTGKQPSQVDRTQFRQQRKQYWKDKANEQPK